MNIINQLLNVFENIKHINIFNLALAIIIAIVFKIFSSVFAYIIIKMFNLRNKDKKKIKRNGFYKPLKVFFVLLGIYVGLRVLGIPENIFSSITKIFKICTIFLIAKGSANLFNSDSDTFEKVKGKLNFKGTDTAVNFLSKIIKTIIYIIAGFIITKELGYDLNGLATGLGIGSVVVALAAQELAKNIIGGFSIIIDKPFEIGDYIETTTCVGTVEDITFRSTRIRDINNQIIVVPNSIVADSSLINATKREKRRYELRLTLELNTPLEKVHELSNTLKELLNSHTSILKDSILVYFDTISNNGIDLQIISYTSIIDYKEFLGFKEQLNYEILATVEKQQIELAYPSQTVYVKNN